EPHVLSISPELFLSRRGGRIVTKPIKGTRPRAADPLEDARHAKDDPQLAGFFRAASAAHGGDAKTAVAEYRAILAAASPRLRPRSSWSGAGGAGGRRVPARSAPPRASVRAPSSRVNAASATCSRWTPISFLPTPMRW
ncbi:MAG TPA: chorismate-binding protein, partial [Thauera aminoaromatica]|nr:chorismate-binding protein [Thauera aminoaromatica]